MIRPKMRVPIDNICREVIIRKQIGSINYWYFLGNCELVEFIIKSVWGLYETTKFKPIKIVGLIQVGVKLIIRN